MRVLYSYCMCSSFFHSSIRVSSEVLQLAVATNSHALRELSYNLKNLKTLYVTGKISCNMLIHKILHYLLTSLPHIMSFTIEQSGGALVNIAPTKTWVPHIVCLMHLQHPRSSMSKPSCLKRSSVSNSEVLGFESPRNCRGDKEKYKDVIDMICNLLIHRHTHTQKYMFLGIHVLPACMLSWNQHWKSSIQLKLSTTNFTFQSILQFDLRWPLTLLDLMNIIWSIPCCIYDTS